MRGSVQRIEKPTGVRYKARYRGGDSRERSRTFTKRSDAERWLSGQVADLNSGRHIDPRHSGVRFGDFAERWLESRTSRPLTIATYDQRMRTHILPTFADRTLGSITKMEVEAWVQSMTTSIAPSTAKAALRLFAAIMRAAASERLISHSPAVDVRAPRLSKPRVAPLTLDQVHLLAAAMPGRYRALVLLSAGTGLRLGEALGVTHQGGVRSLDLQLGEIAVERQLLDLPSEGPTWGPPKSDSAFRTVPLAAVTLTELRRHLDRYPLGPDSVIFTSPKGAFVRRSNLGAEWRTAVERCGFDRPIRFHDLRHYYASVLISSGASVKLVQELLGHSTAGETLNTYAHLWPTEAEVARAAMQAALSAGKRGPVAAQQPPQLPFPQRDWGMHSEAEDLGAVGVRGARSI